MTKEENYKQKHPHERIENGPFCQSRTWSKVFLGLLFVVSQACFAWFLVYHILQDKPCQLVVLHVATAPGWYMSTS